MDEKPTTSIAGIATKYGLLQGVLAFVVFLAGTRATRATFGRRAASTWPVGAT